MRKTLPLLALALALPACAQMGLYGDDDVASASAATAATPRQYVTMAAASDMYEIESSRLALQKSQNNDVRQFAQMMIDHHTKTTADLTAAATRAGVTPEMPKLMPMQADMIAALRRDTGAAFDREYISQQRKSHDMALALHSDYAKTGTATPLRTVAQAAVPVVEDHIRRLRMMP